MEYIDVLKFWFEELDEQGQFSGGEKVDQMIIDRFGRYPHRNAQMGRENTREETEYLASESHSFFAS